MTEAGATPSTLAVALKVGDFGTWGTVTLITTTAVDPFVVGDCHILEYELTARGVADAATPMVGNGRWSTRTSNTLASNVVALAETNFDFTNNWIEIGVWAQWSNNATSSTARLESFTTELA